MVNIMSKNIYKAFGYSIQSDILLPELQQIYNPESNINIDITIRYADLTEKWLELSVSTKKFVVTEDLIMFMIPNLAIFAVEGGTTITISSEKDANEDKLRLYVLGSCMGAILLQRKILPLHGSAVVIDHKAYAFIGDSGHGKSTLASAFIQRGFQLLTDDVIAVTLDQHNIPYVTPAYPQQKLWQESLDTFGMNSDQFRPVFDRETKYAIPVTSHFSIDPLPLAGVFELIKMDCSQPEIRAIEKLERLPLLYRHTYRNLFLPNKGLTPWHFDTTARMSGHIDIYQIQRPLNQPTVHQLTDMVLSSIGK
ncbi:aldolase [Paenibacillus crassostreae]|uniref:Aldolase n=1 Tax=Paenibacillus crassostreae TaxID=1763538 RepID=A0A167GD52_9BACL|nr:aldolase [Paenibacillus crassostreae]AOZ92689.1 aldolase [Paenibacillus crassostreae]OAB77460.1 aldolase [Paenibacillus crassostreae]